MGCAKFISTWHVERGNRTVFSDKSLKLRTFYSDKQPSNETLQRCYISDKLGRHLKVNFQLWKWGRARAVATSIAVVRRVVANDEECVG